jgi:ankyrin repeat protein
MVKMHPVLAEYFEKKPDLYPQALEGKYSRVFNKIMAMWGTEALEAHFSDLIVDKRGGRAGFPAEVAADIILLSRLHTRILETAGMKRPDGAIDPWGDERLRHKLATEQIEYSKEGFLVAVERGNERAVKLFLSAGIKPDQKDALGVTPLIKAAMFNRGAVAAQLIKAHADVNTANAQGYTPLHWAALKGYLDIVEMLLAAGAGVDPRSSLGLTPLMQAAMSGHARVCDALIAKGAGVNESDKRGNTPLHKAVNDGHVAVAELLVAAGADASMGDDRGVTPLAIAQRKKNPAMLAVLSTARRA